MRLHTAEQKAITLACREIEPMLEGIYIGIQLGLGMAMVDKLVTRLQRTRAPSAVSIGFEKTQRAVGVYLGVGE